MAPSYQSQTLMVPSIYSSSHSTNYSSSTSDLNSSTYSPRALYASTFDRPHSSGSAPAGSSLPQRIGMKNMTGFITTEDEFEALPIAVRRKVCYEFFSVISTIVAPSLQTSWMRPKLPRFIKVIELRPIICLAIKDTVSLFLSDPFLNKLIGRCVSVCYAGPVFPHHWRWRWHLQSMRQWILSLNFFMPKFLN